MTNHFLSIADLEKLPVGTAPPTLERGQPLLITTSGAVEELLGADEDELCEAFLELSKVRDGQMKNVLEKELHRMPWFLFKKKSLHNRSKERKLVIKSIFWMELCPV